MKRRTPEPPPHAVVIEGYTDLIRIGAGGFSVVYRAFETALNRFVAVKVLNAGLAAESDRSAFERECKALGQLDHPDIVRVYRPAYTVDDRPCIVMELYEGNFREVLERRGALAPMELLEVGVRMAVALHVAHTKGVLHRDVKPHNIFRSRYGDPALGDFGIATVDGDRTHSGAGGLSVAYAAPELLDDGTTDVSTDVYALCASLHHLASGAAPFTSTDLRQAVRRILTEEPPPIGRTDLPAGFERVVRAGLAKSSSARPGSALEIAEMLREAQARGGLLQTPIKLEEHRQQDTPALRQDATPTPARPPTLAPPNVAGAPAEQWVAGPLVAPPVTDTAAGAVDAAQADGITIARRTPAVAPAPAVEPGISARRRWISAGVAVAVAAIVAGGIVFVGGDDEASPSTTATVTPPDSFLAVVAAPRAATVTAVEGGFAIDVEPVDGVDSYLITPVGAALEPVAVAAGAMPAVVPVTDRPTLCVVVQAVAAGGRVSREAGPFCSGG